jgi:hypothetical protein
LDNCVEELLRDDIEFSFKEQPLFLSEGQLLDVLGKNSFFPKTMLEGAKKFFVCDELCVENFNWTKP